MPAGSCPRCGRAYTAGEVTGMGILRSRLEAHGGPWIEFPCPGCRAMLMLLPYGHARYAVPGEPPPPPPDARERRVPWGAREASPAAGTAGAREAAPPREPLRAAASKAPSPVEGPPPSASAPAGSKPPDPRAPRPTPTAAKTPAHSAPTEPVEAPLDGQSAERLLGLRPGYMAADVEKSFRRSALRCHPDKFSHLDEDFQALAARKFKRLKEARDLLAGS